LVLGVGEQRKVEGRGNQAKPGEWPAGEGGNVLKKLSGVINFLARIPKPKRNN